MSCSGRSAHLLYIPSPICTGLPTDLPFQITQFARGCRPPLASTSGDAWGAEVAARFAGVGRPSNVALSRGELRSVGSGHGSRRRNGGSAALGAIRRRRHAVAACGAGGRYRRCVSPDRAPQQMACRSAATRRPNDHGVLDPGARQSRGRWATRPSQPRAMARRRRPPDRQ